jgi:hypothetical protein
MLSTDVVDDGKKRGGAKDASTTLLAAPELHSVCLMGTQECVEEETYRDDANNNETELTGKWKVNQK